MSRHACSHVSRRLAAHVAALLILLAASPGCGMGLNPLGALVPDLHVELLSISSKTIPGALEDDGDLKDVKLSDRSSFKPSKGAESGIDKRLRMKSTRDAGAACFVSERETMGNASSRVRVAFDSLKGLVDGQSLGFLERRPVQPSEEPVLRIEAIYKLGIDGFGIRYREDGVQLGADEDLPGAHDVQLFLNDLGSSIVAEGARATGEGLDDFSDTITFPAHDQTGGDEASVVAFGSSGLGKSGALYFDQFVLSFDDDVHSGAVEGEIMGKLAFAWLNLKLAISYVPDGLASKQTLIGICFGSSTPLFEAENLLNAGNDNRTLEPTTDFAEVHEDFWEALSSINDAFNILTAEGVSEKDFKKVGKSLEHALGEVELAIGHVNGLKVSSHSKLEKTATFTMD